MLLDWPTVIPELAPKRPRSVEIIEIMVWPDILFSLNQAGVNPLFYVPKGTQNWRLVFPSEVPWKGELTHDASAQLPNYLSIDFTQACLTPVFRQDRIILFG